LEVWDGQAKAADIRLFDLERLVVVGPVQFSTQALALLLDRGIDVSFLTSHGRIRGSLVSGQSRNVYLRLAQFERWREPAFRLALSRHVVTAKVTAQLHVVLRYERNHPGRLEAGAGEQLRQLLEKVPEADSVESLQGLEGAAAAAYYRQFGRMLTTVGFPGRKKHPSTDPANALLSLGYVILGNEIAARLEARGFDPAVGFLHGLRYGRQSLALDLVEAFRQPVVDRLTLRLLNLRQLVPDDFEGGERGLLLKPDALKTYLGLYEEQLRSESEGSGTPTWRERLTAQVDGLREMIMAGEVVPVYTWSGG
ncbi:MAG: CRISPR-associated endonuclease Cas1, partial [Anaerolineales bacterium]